MICQRICWRIRISILWGVVEGGEAFLVIRRLNIGSSFDDGGDEKRFVDIDATAGLINNFHRQSSFLKNREKPLTVPPYI